MEVRHSDMTVAQLNEGLSNGSIVVNRLYQRSPKLWPGPARSYLIDTMLSGFPMPKLSLYQKTDLASRKTTNEIVDGQQRTFTIHDFLEDKLRLSGTSSWAGKRYSDLDEDLQQKFLAYNLSCDIFVIATEKEIREVFQRMNSYQVLLNKQEERHATYQGKFKWHIVKLTLQYSQALKDMEVFTDRQLVRMADARLFTELIFAMENGIESTSEKKLNDLYKKYDVEYDDEASAQVFDQILGDILQMQDIHKGPLMKSYHIYSLFLALAHVRYGPIQALQNAFPIEEASVADPQQIIYNLSALAAALTDKADENAEPGPFANFVEASSKGSNRLGQRLIRYHWICRAVGNIDFPG